MTALPGTRPVRSLRRSGAVRVAAAALPLAALALLLLLGVGPHLLGYRTATMLTSSMEPTAGPGDLLLLSPHPAGSVRPGQALMFTAPVPGGPVLTHRVLTASTGPGGAVTVTTRGDANAAPDPWELTLPPGPAWRLDAVVPGLGGWLAPWRSTGVRLLTVWVLPLGLCAAALRHLWRRDDVAARPA